MKIQYLVGPKHIRVSLILFILLAFAGVPGLPKVCPEKTHVVYIYIFVPNVIESLKIIHIPINKTLGDNEFNKIKDRVATVDFIFNLAYHMSRFDQD